MAIIVLVAFENGTCRQVVRDDAQQLRLYWRESSGLTPASQAVIKALIIAVENDKEALRFPGVDWDLAGLHAASLL